MRLDLGMKINLVRTKERSRSGILESQNLKHIIAENKIGSCRSDILDIAASHSH